MSQIFLNKVSSHVITKALIYCNSIQEAKDLCSIYFK